MEQVSQKRNLMFFVFLCVSFWHKINKNTNHRFRLLEAQLLRTCGAAPIYNLERWRVLLHDCSQTAIFMRAPIDLVRMWLQIIRCLFSLYTSFSLQQLTDWRVARSWRSCGSTQKSHVETRLVRNRPNSDSDCSVYAALQPWAGGCLRCMFRLRRVCVALLCLG